MYDCPSDERRFKQGMDGAQFMTSFQCDICVFRLLFKRNVTVTTQDYDSLMVIRRMILDSLWSREPSTTASNLRSLNKLITNCEVAGIQPNLPKLGPLPFEDKNGMFVAFSMLVHSKQSGKHSKLYTQFATIRKQRSAFSNLFMASRELYGSQIMINPGSQSNGVLSTCPTNSQWFICWSLGCETRMGFILKQNQAISITLLHALLDSFKSMIIEHEYTTIESWNAAIGYAYSVISFFASLRGSKGLKVHFNTLMKHWKKGNFDKQIKYKGSYLPPHVIVPLLGRFKGEQGERCHLLVLANRTKSGIHIRTAIHVLLKMRLINKISSPWLFTDLNGNHMTFDDMNEIILDKLKMIKDSNYQAAKELLDHNVREDFSINRSFRRGSSTTAQVMQIPTDIIELINRWKKIERSKGKKPKFSMIETYSEIELLIPKLVQYSALL